MNEVSFVAGGGIPIEYNFLRLKFGDYHLGIDWGGGFGETLARPRYDGPIDILFASHAHLDHILLVPELCRRYPHLKVFGTAPTRDLGLLQWRQTIRKAKEEKKDPPYEEEDIQRALSAWVTIEIDQEIKLTDDLTVLPVNAGHILGAISLLIIYKGEVYFVTNDLCFHTRYLIEGAPKLELKRCRLLVRESTYINRSFGDADRRATELRLIEDCKKVIKRKGRVLIPTLTIDRNQHMLKVLLEAGFEEYLYVDGGWRQTQVYMKYLGDKAADLAKARRFKNNRERRQFLDNHQPAIILASSGMVYPKTLSAVWAENLLYDQNDAVFLVNYQDPMGQGFILKNAKKGDLVTFNDSIIQVNCQREDYNFSSHMSGSEGTELESRMNPDVVAYTHGESAEIDRYIAEHRNGICRRVKAEVGKEVEL